VDPGTSYVEQLEVAERQLLVFAHEINHLYQAERARAAGADVDDSFSAASPVAGTDGALVILATTPQAAQRLAAAAVTSSLSAIVRVG